MTRSIEFLIRLAVLGIFLFIKTESFSNISYTDMVSSIGTLLVVLVPFLIKFRDEESQVKAYPSIRHLLPFTNIFLIVLLLVVANSVNYLESNVGIVALGVFLIAILQTFDLVFLKKLKRELKV